MKDLHEELETFDLSNWMMYALVHAMIDAGIVTSLECQHPNCKLDDRAFSKERGKGHAYIEDAMSIDHIIPRRDGGSHRIENLCLAHRKCNYGWRAGHKGSFLDDDARARIASSLRGRKLTAKHKDNIAVGLARHHGRA